VKTKGKSAYAQARCQRWKKIGKVDCAKIYESETPGVELPRALVALESVVINNKSRNKRYGGESPALLLLVHQVREI